MGKQFVCLFLLCLATTMVIATEVPCNCTTPVSPASSSWLWGLVTYNGGDSNNNNPIVVQHLELLLKEVSELRAEVRSAHADARVAHAEIAAMKEKNAEVHKEVKSIGTQLGLIDGLLRAIQLIVEEWAKISGKYSWILCTVVHVVLCAMFTVFNFSRTHSFMFTLKMIPRTILPVICYWGVSIVYEKFIGGVFANWVVTVAAWSAAGGFFYYSVGSMLSARMSCKLEIAPHVINSNSQAEIIAAATHIVFDRVTAWMKAEKVASVSASTVAPAAQSTSTTIPVLPSMAVAAHTKTAGVPAQLQDMNTTAVSNPLDKRASYLEQYRLAEEALEALNGP